MLELAPALGEWVEGKYGKGLQLDGATHADVEQEQAEAFSLPIFTIAAWIGDKEVGGHQYVLCKGGVSANRNYIIRLTCYTNPC